MAIGEASLEKFTDNGLGQLNPGSLTGCLAIVQVKGITMKKKSLPKPLTLNRETLRELTSTEPSLVKGGQAIDSAYPSCTSARVAC